MPVLAQRDIFSFADSSDLLFVFGHRGFNEIGVTWEGFIQRFPTLESIGEPVVSIDAKPFEYAPGRVLVTAAEEPNCGMSDDLLRETFDRYVHWAFENGLHQILTNGVMDTDHLPVSSAVFASKSRRAQLIIDYAERHEQETDMSITLSSLSPIFSCNGKKSIQIQS